MNKKIVMLAGRQKTNNRDGYETHASGRVSTNQKRTSSLGGEDVNITMRSFTRKALIGMWLVFDESSDNSSDFHRVTFILDGQM